MGEWDQMSEYVSRLDDGDENKLRSLGNTTASGDGSSNGAFFRAVLSVRCKKVEYFPILNSSYILSII
jgi:FKBP12-rapamycin complex-associated protein